MASRHFDAPAVADRFPAIGGGAAFDPDAYHDDSRYPTGDRVTRDDADVVAGSAEEIPDDVPPGSTVWLESNAVINAAGRRWHTLTRRDVTLASGRGLDGPGAAIRNDRRVARQFPVDGTGCRVTGIRFEGPAPDEFENDPYPASEALSINANDVEVDNCSFAGFTHAGVEVGREAFPKFLHIHHSEFVDNHAKGLGYGVTVFHGNPWIRACFFDVNRHSIAGDGAPDCSWRLTDSIVGRYSLLHALDMHEDENEPGKAGKKVDVRRCVVLPTENTYNASGESGIGQEALSIRAIPRVDCPIRRSAWGGDRPREPMRDGDNAAINVHGASTLGDGKLVGIDSNVFGWRDGEVLPDGIGPTRDPTVTGYGTEDGTGGGDGTDDGSNGGRGDDSSMTQNPTAGRDGEMYDVRLRGTGNVSQYELIGAEAVAFPNDEEKHERVDGRTAYGQLSTLEDVVRVTGPIVALRVTSGDPSIGVEIEGDGTTYRPADFPDSEPDGGTIQGTVRIGGTAFDVALEIRER